MEGFSSFDEDEESEDANPHGFISADAIGKFRKTKSETKRELKDAKRNAPKEKRYSGPKPKKGGTNDKEKQKRKPLLMLRPKKNFDRKRLSSVKSRIKEIKNKLGHVRSGK